MSSTTKDLWRDPANLITLAGLAVGTIGLYAALAGQFAGAVLGLLIAFAADYLDGPVARNTRGRSEKASALGVQLDGMADLVCHSVAPALLLLCYGKLEPRFLPAAVFFVLAGTVRMARNNVDGMISETHYRGLSSENNVVVLAMVFLVEPWLRGRVFADVFQVALVITGLLNLSTLPVPKVTGRGYYGVAAWTLALGAVFVSRLLLG